jgi:hypothetical protein
MQAEAKRALIDAALQSGAISTPAGFRRPDHVHASHAKRAGTSISL